MRLHSGRMIGKSEVIRKYRPTKGRKVKRLSVPVHLCGYSPAAVRHTEWVPFLADACLEAPAGCLFVPAPCPFEFPHRFPEIHLAIRNAKPCSGAGECRSAPRPEVVPES